MHLIVLVFTPLIAHEMDFDPQTPDQKNLFGIFNLADSGFGGSGIKFTRFRDQKMIMTGGHGGCIFRDRFVLGGGGYGVVNNILLEHPVSDTFRLLKMGYGGIEFGYIPINCKMGYISCSLLAAVGAVFWENLPGKGAHDLEIVPVFEPAINGVVPLTKALAINSGVTYRFVNGIHSENYTNRELSSFTGYVILLFKGL